MLTQSVRADSPIVPGHEVIGRVVAVGDRVEDWRVGDRVGAGWHGGQDGWWALMIKSQPPFSRLAL